jgi:hypothetical protein
LGHADDVPAGQFPTPSQFIALTNVDPLHWLSRHGTVVAANEQPAAPLHDPAQAPVPPHSCLPSTGWPEVSDLQVPTELARLQAWHWPSHWPSQQTWSTQ